MIFSFKDKNTRELYETGVSRSKDLIHPGAPIETAPATYDKAKAPYPF